MWLVLQGLSTHSHWFQHFRLLHFWNGLWTALSLLILAPWCSHDATEDIITLPSDSLTFILFSSICIFLISASLCSPFYRISDFCFLVPHQTLSPNGQDAHTQESMVVLLSCLGEIRDTFSQQGLSAWKPLRFCFNHGTCANVMKIEHQKHKVELHKSILG